MKKNNTLRNILVSIVAIAAIALCIWFVKGGNAKADTDGSIKVTVVELDGSVVNEKSIGFKEGDDLVTLLEENFDNVDVEDGFLYSIDTLTTPEDWSTWIALYVDGEMSEVGILEVKYTDGTEISFVNTEMSYD